MESAVSCEKSTSPIQNPKPEGTSKTQKNSKRQHQQPWYLTNEQQDDILTWLQVIFIVGTVYLVLITLCRQMHARTINSTVSGLCGRIDIYQRNR
ncbi:hypothetical protein DPMN_148854 [Dreissena polymorpha]|uniref:Uncharacterized protein n=1 Tax=Dreissena polymorpha TaxID=45954 RepID=A0A9D4J484_DREPO|nr:hypothetical protein DPMN_148854 [Dreissena polymorpha]